MNLNIENPLEKAISKIESWLDGFISMLPNMAVAILLMIFFVVLAKLVKNLINRLMKKTTRNKLLKNLFSTLTFYSILGLGLFVILGVLGLQKTVTSLLAGVGIIGIGLGFAFQDITANFLSGIILGFKTPFVVNDVVEIKDIMGTVTNVGIRSTTVKTFQGQFVYIPNKDVLQNPIYNFSKLGKRRIDIPIGISYTDDLQKVEKVVLETLKNMKGVVDHQNLIFDYYEFGSSSINFYIRFWIEYPGPPEFGYFVLKNQAIKEIKKAFDREDITIPFPIRTLDFNGNRKPETPEFNIVTHRGNNMAHQDSQDEST